MRAKVSFVLLSAVSSTVLSDSLSVPPKLTALSHYHIFGTFFIANLILSTSAELPTHSNSISFLHSHPPIPFRTAVIHWGVVYCISPSNTLACYGTATDFSNEKLLPGSNDIYTVLHVLLYSFFLGVFA
jgi:hypothetical protein